MTGHETYRTFILCFFTSLVRISRPLGLTIDNQLAIIANDCYTRVSIGTNLPKSDIVLSKKVETLSDCEEECSKKRISCHSFSFGVDLKGNATCNLGMQIAKFESLSADPDFDVYVRSQRSQRCEFDEILNLQNGLRPVRKNDSTPIQGFGSGLLPSPSRNRLMNYPSVASSTDDDLRVSDIVRNHERPVGYDLQSTYSALVSHKDSKLPSSTENRKSVPENGLTFGQRIHYGRPIDYTAAPFGRLTNKENPFTTNRPIFDHPTQQIYEQKPFAFSRPNSNYHDLTTTGPQFYFHQADRNLYLSEKYKNRKEDFPTRNIFHPNEREESFHSQRWDIVDSGRKELKTYTLNDSSPFVKVSHVNKETNFGFEGLSTASFFDDIHGRFGEKIPVKYKLVIATVRRSVQDSLIILENVNADDCGPCYRRLFSGKKMLDMHIRRAIECQKIDDCHRACDYEKLFVCAGFNYRHTGRGERGMCELTSTPYPRMDVHRDFAIDPRCDYYEKNLNCPEDTYGSKRRPDWSYDYPTRHGELPRPIIPGRPDPETYKTDWRFFKELPRPLDHDLRRPRPEVERERPPAVYGPPYEPYDPYDNQQPYPPVRMHFGRPYLPRRPDDFHDENRIYPSKPTYEEFYLRNFHRPPPLYVDRRTGYEPRPHEIGTNEIGPYYSNHRKDPNRYWGVHGGIYGSSFPHDTNNVGSFDGKNLSHQSPRPEQHHPQRTYENDHFYGEFYNYGGAFGYGDNYALSYRDFIYGGIERDQDCSIRAGAGFKLGRAIVGNSYLTANLDQCESLCVTEKAFSCMTFAFRYNVASTDPTDNCLLSGLPYKELNFYTDLVPDRDYDIYAVIGDPKTCKRNKPTNHPPPDECFWRIRSGFGMPPDVTRKTVLVDGIGECQIQCTTAPGFTCRSFAFRYGESRNQQDKAINCFLSDWPSQEIDPANMPDMDGAELYERGSFGRGCEPYPLPPFNSVRIGKNKAMHGDDGCYAGYHRPCKLTSYAVLVSTRAETEAECRAKCTQMRNKDSAPCMSFSFRLMGHGADENCLLSDVPIRDLRPGVDYTYADQHVLYAWRDLDPRCYVSVYALDDDHVFGAPGYGSNRPLTPGPTYIGPGSGHNPETGHGVITDRPRPRPSYGPPYETVGQEYPGKPIGDGYNDRPIDHGYGERPVGSGYEGRPTDDGYGNGVTPLDPNRPDPLGPAYVAGRPRPDFPDSMYNQGRPRPIPFGPTYDEERPRPGAGPFYHPGEHGPPESGGHGLAIRPIDHDGSNLYDSRPARPSYGYGSYGITDNKYPTYKPGFTYPADELAIFRHFTVNGYPCKKGTRCEKNRIAGFWSCETEGSEFGSWDYCCSPNSRCGYSKGYHYPWCYVGLTEDQWRPCSDKYYPYLPSPRPLRPKPKFRDNDDDHRHFYINSLAPDFSTRHWPVIYVHGQPPPNCTDSIASADNTRNRRMNESLTLSPTEKTNGTSTVRQKMRKRRLRPRTIVDNRAGIALSENMTLSYANKRLSNLTNTNIARRQFVQVKMVDSKTELPTTNNGNNERDPVFSTSTATVPRGSRMGKVERISKPLLSRQTNSTDSP